MTWVGEDNIDHSHSDSMWYPHSSLSQRGVVNIDFDKIVRNISELNILAGVDTSIVTHTHKGAVLKVSIIIITVYIYMSVLVYV